MLRMAASHQNKKMKGRGLNMRMAMTEQELMKVKILMQTTELNGKKVVAKVQLQAIPGNVKSATSGPRWQAIFANQINVSHN